MNSRERLLAALRGEPVDRVPTWLLFPYHLASYYVDVRTNPCYVPIFERSRERAVTLDRRNLWAPLFGAEVETLDESLVAGDGWTVDRHTLRFDGRALVSKTRRRVGEVVRKPLLATESDLDTLLTFPINDDPARVAEALEPAARAYLAERAEFPPRVWRDDARPRRTDRFPLPPLRPRSLRPLVAHLPREGRGLPRPRHAPLPPRL